MATTTATPTPTNTGGAVAPSVWTTIATKTVTTGSANSSSAIRKSTSVVTNGDGRVMTLTYYHGIASGALSSSPRSLATPNWSILLIVIICVVGLSLLGLIAFLVVRCMKRRRAHNLG